MMKYCFGVDVGGTTVKLGLFTVEGELLDKWEIKTYTENEGERILPDVAEAIKGKIAEKLLKAEEICGIGVGVPAPVDKNGAIERAANVGWMAKEIKKELEELTGFPCVIGNDANVAALGEMWKGAGEGEKEITWNSVINPKKTVVAVCSFYTDLSQMLVNSILNGVTKKSVVSPLEILLFDSFVSFIFHSDRAKQGGGLPGICGMDHGMDELK